TSVLVFQVVAARFGCRYLSIGVTTRLQMTNDCLTLVLDIGQGWYIRDQQRLGNMPQSSQAALIDQAQDKVQLQSFFQGRIETANFKHGLAPKQPVPRHASGKTE